MKTIKEILLKHNLKPTKYEFKNKAAIVNCNNKKYVVKKNEKDFDVYKYLNSRSFNYYPKILIKEDYEVMEYIDDVDMPEEQRMFDLINLVGLLHSKTTYYKEVDLADYKELYEHISNNIVYLHSYYDDLASIIESKVYMSPAEYLLIRNISKIYEALNFCRVEIETWYDLVKDKKKQRYVVLHNNLELDHFLKNERSYLISWNNSKEGIPVFDIYKLYKKSNVEFGELLKHYEKVYPLLNEERILFFILISLPDKIELNKDEYELCLEISKKIELLFKTQNLLLPYYFKETKEQ